MKVLRILLYTIGFFGIAGAGILMILQLFIFSCVTYVPDASAQTLRFASYNVHYIIANRDDGSWSVGDWEQRKDSLSAAVKELSADIIGFQEMETFRWPDGGDENLTLDWLQAEHPLYTAGAVGNPEIFPSTQPIFFRTERFTLQDEGWFFFSDTPDVIYSRTYNGSYPAFATWVTLEDSVTSQIFRVVNIHTDFKSYSNRRQSLELVSIRVAPWLADGEAVFVIGDYNAWLGSRLHGILETDGFTFAPLTASTYHFNHGLHLFPAIDHVAFAGADIKVESAVVLQQKFLNQWPTDHHPILVDISFDSP
jgi:endonuclease/exonuclease/phosphatase family metal-dependent hydrolase